MIAPLAQDWTATDRSRAVMLFCAYDGFSAERDISIRIEPSGPITIGGKIRNGNRLHDASRPVSVQTFAETS
jgi:hypothetical protein